MPDLLLLALGALALAAVQAVGLLTIALIGENPRDAASYWYGLTGWPIWLAPYILRERRRRRAYLARQDRAPAPELGENFRINVDERRDERG